MGVKKMILSTMILSIKKGLEIPGCSFDFERKFEKVRDKVLNTQIKQIGREK